MVGMEHDSAAAEDRLAKIKHDDECGLELGRSDFDWLVREVERLQSFEKGLGWKGDHSEADR